jgi:hypothetical protein
MKELTIANKESYASNNAKSTNNNYLMSLIVSQVHSPYTSNKNINDEVFLALGCILHPDGQ